jgi:hypothetical protein
MISVKNIDQDSVLPGFVPVRETVVYTVFGLIGILLSRQVRGVEGELSIGVLIGVVIGVNIAGYVGQKRDWRGLDEVTMEVIDRAMIYGFVFFLGAIVLGLATSLSFTTAQEMVAGASGLMLGMVIEGLRENGCS